MKKLLFLAATLLLVISCKVTDLNEPDDSNTFGEKSGVCGDNLIWILTDDGVLTISGIGDMYDYLHEDSRDDEATPWASEYDSNTTIKEIKIQNGVTSIGNGAFANCVNLKSITIPNTITKIGLSAFFNCNNLTNVTIPNSVTEIRPFTFYGCSSLTSVTIPNSVTRIADCVFSCCSGLTTIIVEEGNTVYDSRNNCNAIIVDDTLIAGCKNTIIPNSVTSIAECAFMGCSGLTSITIPNSVTSIDPCAFEGCSGLSSIYNYASVPPRTGDNTFEGVNTDICILYVPKESVELYKEAEVWQDFQQIVGIDVPED